MLDQSRSVIVNELKKSLESLQKSLETIKNPSQLPELHKAQEIARKIVQELSEPRIRSVVSSADIERILDRSQQVLRLEPTDKPHQALSAINQLQLQIKVLLDNLHGNPKVKPNYPWDDDEKEKDQKEKEDKEKDQKEKKDDKENKTGK